MSDVHGLSALIRRAQDGDQSAMDAILERLRPELERIARRYSDPRRVVESTADVVQEAWIKVWDKLGQFNGNGNDQEATAMFRSWVEQIVRRVGLNVQRAWRAPTRKPRNGAIVSLAGRSDRPDVDPPGCDPTPSARVSIDEEARLVRDAIERLPDDTSRRLVIGRFFDGLSLREAARRVGLPYRTALRRFDTALAEIERKLGG